MTHPTDAAIAQAFREAVRDWNTEAHWHFVHDGITRRARELDAEKGGAGGNTGHGHVWPRPDGVKARCGGPGLCAACSIDASRYRATPPAQAAEGVERVERVARASALASSAMVGYDTELFWSCLDERAREHWRIVARAAIAAMQESTK